MSDSNFMVHDTPARSEACSPDKPEPSADCETIRTHLLSRIGGWEAFERSFHARTHYPEKSAKSALDGGVEYWLAGVQALAAVNAPDDLQRDWLARFISKWVAYQAAGARVMNWFITGPARFPVERNNQRMATEMRRYDELKAHVDGAAQWARRRMASNARAQLSADAKASGEVSTTREVAGVRLVQNTAIDRVQLVFDGKPTPEIIAELKGRAFRWSPREGAWQRQLTRNGLWAAEAVLKRLTPAAPMQAAA